MAMLAHMRSRSAWYIPDIDQQHVALGRLHHSSIWLQRSSDPGALLPTQVCGLPFDPPSFSPSKLTVAFDAETGALQRAPLPVLERRYTLTHNDITGALLLTVGRSYSAPQLSGWYIRLLRDEVLAEWAVRDCGAPQLHLYCHVSGQERWLAPPQLRNYIFKREMPLVLDTLAWAERDLLATQPQFADARVFVHLKSNVQDLNCTVEWGRFGFRDSWRRTPSSILQRILGNFPGVAGVPSGSTGSNSSRRSLSDAASGSSKLGGPDTSSSSSSSWRLCLFARLDDSIDESDFMPLSAMNDPYRELQEMRAAQTDRDGIDAIAASSEPCQRQASADSLAAASAVEGGNLPLQQANADIAAAAVEGCSRQPGSALWLPPEVSGAASDENGSRSPSATGSREAEPAASSAGSASFDEYCQQQWQQWRHEEGQDAVLANSDSSSSTSVGFNVDQQLPDIALSTSSTSNSGGSKGSGSSDEAENDQQFLAFKVNGSCSGSNSSSSNSSSSSSSKQNSTDSSLRCDEDNSDTSGSGSKSDEVSRIRSSSAGSDQPSSSRHSLSAGPHSWQSICAKWPTSSDGHAVVCSASYDEY